MTTPTLSGHILFAKDSFAAMDMPPVRWLHLRPKHYRALCEELLVDELAHLHGMEIVIDPDVDDIVMQT